MVDVPEQNPVTWKFTQLVSLDSLIGFTNLVPPPRCFGDKGDVEDITEGEFGDAQVSSTDMDPADIISTVEFDQSGNYLATGDKGGRVVLFERNESVRPKLSLLKLC